MNTEKLKRLQAQVRIGGKGTPRRKKKVMHQSAATDDKKLQSSLKKLSVSTIPGIEEVNIIKDDLTVIHFNNPKAQASLSANTFAVTGHGESKKIVEMLPEILPQLGQETVMQLRMFANSMAQGDSRASRIFSAENFNATDKIAEEDDDDEVPLLINDFEQVAKLEEASKAIKATKIVTFGTESLLNDQLRVDDNQSNEPIVQPKIEVPSILTESSNQSRNAAIQQTSKDEKKDKKSNKKQPQNQTTAHNAVTKNKNDTMRDTEDRKMKQVKIEKPGKHDTTTAPQLSGSSETAKNIKKEQHKQKLQMSPKNDCITREDAKVTEKLQKNDTEHKKDKSSISQLGKAEDNAKVKGKYEDAKIGKKDEAVIKMIEGKKNSKKSEKNIIKNESMNVEEKSQQPSEDPILMPGISYSTKKRISPDKTKNEGPLEKKVQSVENKNELHATRGKQQSKIKLESPIEKREIPSETSETDVDADVKTRSNLVKSPNKNKKVTTNAKDTVPKKALEPNQNQKSKVVSQVQKNDPTIKKQSKDATLNDEKKPKDAVNEKISDTNQNQEPISISEDPKKVPSRKEKSKNAKALPTPSDEKKLKDAVNEKVSDTNQNQNPISGADVQKKDPSTKEKSKNAKPLTSPSGEKKSKDVVNEKVSHTNQNQKAKSVSQVQKKDSSANEKSKNAKSLSSPSGAKKPKDPVCEKVLDTNQDEKPKSVSQVQENNLSQKPTSKKASNEKKLNDNIVDETLDQKLKSALQTQKIESPTKEQSKEARPLSTIGDETTPIPTAPEKFLDQKPKSVSQVLNNDPQAKNAKLSAPNGERKPKDTVSENVLESSQNQKVKPVSQVESSDLPVKEEFTDVKSLSTPRDEVKPTDTTIEKDLDQKPKLIPHTQKIVSPIKEKSKYTKSSFTPSEETKIRDIALEKDLDQNAKSVSQIQNKDMFTKEQSKDSKSSTTKDERKPKDTVSENTSQNEKAELVSQVESKELPLKEEFADVKSLSSSSDEIKPKDTTLEKDLDQKPNLIPDTQKIHYSVKEKSKYTKSLSTPSGETKTKDITFEKHLDEQPKLIPHAQKIDSSVKEKSKYTKSLSTPSGETKTKDITFEKHLDEKPKSFSQVQNNDTFMKEQPKDSKSSTTNDENKPKDTISEEISNTSQNQNTKSVSQVHSNDSPTKKKSVDETKNLKSPASKPKQSDMKISKGDQMKSSSISEKQKVQSPKNLPSPNKNAEKPSTTTKVTKQPKGSPLQKSSETASTDNIISTSIKNVSTPQILSKSSIGEEMQTQDAVQEKKVPEQISTESDYVAKPTNNTDEKSLNKIIEDVKALKQQTVPIKVAATPAPTQQSIIQPTECTETAKTIPQLPPLDVVVKELPKLTDQMQTSTLSPTTTSITNITPKEIKKDSIMKSINEQQEFQKTIITSALEQMQSVIVPTKPQDCDVTPKESQDLPILTKEKHQIDKSNVHDVKQSTNQGAASNQTTQNLIALVPSKSLPLVTQSSNVVNAPAKPANAEEKNKQVTVSTVSITSVKMEPISDAIQTFKQVNESEKQSLTLAKDKQKIDQVNQPIQSQNIALVTEKVSSISADPKAPLTKCTDLPVTRLDNEGKHMPQQNVIQNIITEGQLIPEISSNLQNVPNPMPQLVELSKDINKMSGKGKDKEASSPVSHAFEGNIQLIQKDLSFPSITDEVTKQSQVPGIQVNTAKVTSLPQGPNSSMSAEVQQIMKQETLRTQMEVQSRPPEIQKEQVHQKTIQMEAGDKPQSTSDSKPISLVTDVQQSTQLPKSSSK